jgi:UDP-glucose 4-epimerase
MAHYLVTGGCGFIGSHLVERLMADGHQVSVIDDLSSGRQDRHCEGATLFVGSIIDPPVLRAAIAEIDGVFHLAAVVSAQRCARSLIASHMVNLSGFVLLLQTLRDRGRRVPVVYASSAAVYGNREGMVGEQIAPRPISHDGSDKLGCELHARAALASCGIASIGLRLFNVYGPGQDAGSPYSGVIPIFMDRAARGEAITIQGDGNQMRDFIFVQDVVRAQCAAMARLEARSDASPTAEVFNICTGRGVTISQLAKLAQSIWRRSVDVVQTEARQEDMRLSLGCPDAAAAVLGFEAETEIAGGLMTLRQRCPGARRPRLYA